MGRKKNTEEEKLVYKRIGMKQSHWDEVKEAANKKEWSVNRFVRNVSVTFARGENKK